jgi:hypothetical protein
VGWRRKGRRIGGKNERRKEGNKKRKEIKLMLNGM